MTQSAYDSLSNASASGVAGTPAITSWSMISTAWLFTAKPIASSASTLESFLSTKSLTFSKGSASKSKSS